jgi:hypothetical protein
MARRDTHRAAWTLFVAVAVALGSGLDAGQAGHRCSTDHPKAWSIGRYPTPMP